jgi:hypothetical protein
MDKNYLSIVGTLKMPALLIAENEDDDSERMLIFTVECQELNLEISAQDRDHKVGIPLALLCKGARVQIAGYFSRMSPERHLLLYPDAPTVGVMILESAAIVS